jgi:PAS domain S-box-containing protein
MESFDTHPAMNINLIASLFSNTTDEIWAVDNRYCLTYYNRTLQRNMLAAYHISLSLNTNLPALFDSLGLEEIASKFIRYYDRVLGGESFTVTECYQVPGQPVYKELLLFPVQENERIIGAGVFSRDVTERVLARQAAERATQRLQAAYQSSQSGLLIYEAIENEIGQPVDFVLTDVNQLAADLFTAPALYRIGQRLTHTAPALVTSGIFALFCQVYQSGRMIDRDVQLPGLRAEWVQLTCVKSEDGLFISFRDITHKKQMEKALEESENRYKIISTVSNDVLWNWDLIQNTIEWSDGFAKISGYPPEKTDYTIDEWKGAIHCDDRGRVIERIEKALLDTSAHEWQDEYRIVSLAGAVSHVIDKGCIIRDSVGKAVRMMGGMHDVTQLKNQQMMIEEALRNEQKLNRQLTIREEQLAAREQELSSSEEELRQLNEQLTGNNQLLSEKEFLLQQSHRIAKIGSWQYHLSSGQIEWSAELYQMLGYPPQTELTPHQIRDLLGENNFQVFNTAFGQLFEEKGILNLTVHCRDYARHPIWLHLTGYTIRTGQLVTRIVGLAQDITHQKQIELQLRSSEEKFSKIFELSPDILVLIRESDQTILNVNQQLVTYRKQDLIGKSAAAMNFWVDPADRETFLAQYYSKGLVVMETWMQGKDFSRVYVAIHARRIVIEGEKHILAVVRDLTEREQAEAKIRTSESNLSAIIDNADMSIWSVDRQYRLVAFNSIFRQAIYHDFQFTVTAGSDMLDPALPGFFTRSWKDKYDRALAGEQFRLVEKTPDQYYEFSLNPIVNRKEITGVAVYARDITGRIEQEEQIRQSTLALAEAHTKLGELKMMALRAVMNPHFIFNALNSIQYFVSNNESENAIRYLSYFSKLIRGVLENSLQNKIRLSEELQLLRYYIRLELIRFDEKFDVHFEIASEVDLENTEIPSLLIQPFVENAILHGLYNKKERGNLYIRIAEKDNTLRVTIEDDGIGRKAAADLQQKSLTEHRSRGMIITQERLALLNQGRQVSIQIDDLFHGGVAAGTRVTISLPIT